MSINLMRQLYTTIWEETQLDIKYLHHNKEYKFLQNCLSNSYKAFNKKILNELNQKILNLRTWNREETRDLSMVTIQISTTAPNIQSWRVTTSYLKSKFKTQQLEAYNRREQESKNNVIGSRSSTMALSLVGIDVFGRGCEMRREQERYFWFKLRYDQIFKISIIKNIIGDLNILKN